jgi:hypothetical protein
VRKNIRDVLDDWPRLFIWDRNIAALLNKTDDACHGVIKRAKKAGLLVRMRRGLYLIANKAKRTLPDEFELAILMYGPSIISLESALSYHGWIPEGVYTTTCVSPKRAHEFKTPIGVFSYKRVPAKGFYQGVNRIETSTGIILIASPWRALADFIYTSRKTWENLSQLDFDMRIDIWTIMESDKEILKLLSEQYPSQRVRKQLLKFLNEIEAIK